jgi:hypothetical protein
MTEDHKRTALSISDLLDPSVSCQLSLPTQPPLAWPPPIEVDTASALYLELISKNIREICGFTVIAIDPRSLTV